MAADYSVYEDVLKEVWTQDRLEKQFYDQNLLLDTIEKTSKYKVGKVAKVPVHLDRSGGYTIVPEAGSSSLNPADNQKVGVAEFKHTRHWFQVQIDTNAITSSEGPLAVASAMDSEVTGAIENTRHQVAAQAFGDGTGFLAKCGTSTTTTTITLASGDTWALDRGYLYPGLTVDIGTTSNPVSQTGAGTPRQITAIDTANNTITISGANITTSSSHFVSIAGSRSGSTFYGMNGLNNIIGTGAFGGLTDERWKSFAIDSPASAEDLSLEKLLDIQRKIFQQRGGRPDWNLTSPLQQQLFYLLLQSQARFSGDTGIGAGNDTGATWSGMRIDAQPDCPDDEWFMLTKKHLFMVRTDKPYWVTQKYGGSILEWKQGTTNLVGALEYYAQLATNRRSAHGKLTNLSLTAPAA
jgi:hypothetical protein